MSSGAGSPEVLEALADPGRLAALEGTGLLGSGPSEALDDLAGLARDVIAVPVALVTLVDPEGQTFVGSSGLEDAGAAGRRAPLSHSFCQYVVAQAEPLVVSDATEHPVL